MENARLKNSGRAPKGSKDGLRPESPQSRKPRRPPVRKMVQTGKARFEVHDKYELLFLFMQTFHQYYEMQGGNLAIEQHPIQGIGGSDNLNHWVKLYLGGPLGSNSNTTPCIALTR